MVFDYISYWAFIGHRYEEKESPLPDGGATIHLDDERDSCQPSRTYESNCSGFIPAPSGNDLGAPEHYSGLARTICSNNSSDLWDSSITQGPITIPETHWVGAGLHIELWQSFLGWCPGLKQRRGLHRLLQRGGRREKNNTLDKIHQQRLTTNGCMLAATINMTQEDKMKNSKWRNQRTCQRLSVSVPHTQQDHILTRQELDFLEKK